MGVVGCGEKGLFRLFRAIGEKAVLYRTGPMTPDECLDRHNRPCAELWRDLLKGMGVPCGEMKGVLHSDSEPNVAAREMSDEDELKVMPSMNPAPDDFPFPGKRWRGSADPELCLDLIMGTGVLRGEMNGLAEGL